MIESQTGSANPVPPVTGQINEDDELLASLEQAILRSVKGQARFISEAPHMVRKAVDEVIDSPRTGRFLLEELEKTEKTYLGTKVEILLRNWLALPRGDVLDLSIDGIETDVKNTVADDWMIPHEAVDRPCLLVMIDDKCSRFSIGLIVARKAYLRDSKNQDGKGQISAAGKRHIKWLIRDASYPENPWQRFDPEIRKSITKPGGGSKRVDALFRLIQKTPISRSLVLGVALQKDAMRRLRRNGGARDSLARDGIVLLSGNYDKKQIEALGLPKCRRDEFISFTAVTEPEKKLLQTKNRSKKKRRK
jgi:hypothetical protein